MVCKNCNCPKCLKNKPKVTVWIYKYVPNIEIKQVKIYKHQNYGYPKTKNKAKQKMITHVNSLIKQYKKQTKNQKKYNDNQIEWWTRRLNEINKL